MPQSIIFSTLKASEERKTLPTLFILLTLSKTTVSGVFDALLYCSTLMRPSACIDSFSLIVLLFPVENKYFCLHYKAKESRKALFYLSPKWLYLYSTALLFSQSLYLLAIYQKKSLLSALDLFLHW